VLALAAAAERADKVDVVCVDEARIRAANLVAQDTPGETPVTSLREYHVDVQCLDYVRLGTVANLVSDALKAASVVRVTRKNVLALLVDAVRNGLVVMEELQENVRDEVQKRLQPSEGSK
jgi:ssRNA-specific RNase YbeY (16S rRNA maturation enzyme)